MLGCSPRSPLARVVWGNRASKVNELLRGFGVNVPYTVPAIADVADDGQEEEVDAEAEMDEEEGDTNAPRKDKRQKKASRPARTSTSRTRASGRVADLPLTKRRLRPAQNK